MKQKYYVNDTPQTNGDHEIHVPTCYFFSMIKNRTYLGEFETCYEAVHKAKKLYSTANGCIHCCPQCHTR